jgi:transglutaminase-like putative cysteine protease
MSRWHSLVLRKIAMYFECIRLLRRYLVTERSSGFKSPPRRIIKRKMKKIFFLIAFLISAQAASALNEDLIYSTEQIRAMVDVGSEIELSSYSSDYSISYMTANLSFIPLQRDFQQIVSATYSPQPYEAGKGYVVFRWENPGLGKYTYNINSEIITKVNRNRVKQKVDFPMKNLGPEFDKYLNPTPNIDSDDPEIVKTASQLAEGEDDAYIVVGNLVSWVQQNVNYSLNSMTEKVSQPASWVIINRYGVCDEITSLFIAMARSLGIPARFVSGVAYTNFNDINDWGNHAWAEIYYPGAGWVAYDVTYSELGYTDATHIVLKESTDSNESSTESGCAGTKIKDVQLDAEQTGIKVKLLEKTGVPEPEIAITAGAYKEKIGFGSYDVIEAEIRNLMDYYVSEEVSLANVAEITAEGSADRQIVLKPKETKKIYWLVKLSDGLSRKYIYTLPVLVYTSRNVTGKSSIESADSYREYSEADMQEYIGSRTEEEQKSYSRTIAMNCAAQEKLFLGDTLHIICSIQNEGNAFINNLRVCLESDCSVIDLGISKSADVNYDIIADAVGEQDYSVKASNNDISKTAYLTAVVYDKPDIKISNITYRENLKFGEQFELKFVAEKTSFSNPLNTKIEVTNGRIVGSVDYGELKSEQDFAFNFDTKEMAKKNDILIRVTYTDDKGDVYESQKTITAYVEADRFWDRIKMWMNRIFG